MKHEVAYDRNHGGHSIHECTWLHELALMRDNTYHLNQIVVSHVVMCHVSHVMRDWILNL